MLLDRCRFFLGACSPSSSSLESLELLSDEPLESDEESFLPSAVAADPFLDSSIFDGGALLSSSLVLSDSELLLSSDEESSFFAAGFAASLVTISFTSSSSSPELSESLLSLSELESFAFVNVGLVPCFMF